MMGGGGKRVSHSLLSKYVSGRNYRWFIDAASGALESRENTLRELSGHFTRGDIFHLSPDGLCIAPFG